MKKPVFLIVGLCIAGASAFAEDLTPKYLKTDEEGLIWYETPVNNGVFVINYQLEGTFELAASEDDMIAFLFTGNVYQHVSGNQLGSVGGQASQIKCSVVHLPVRIESWTDSESKRWGPVMLKFEELRKVFEKGEKYSLRVALKAPSYVFASTGDLIVIKARQFHYENIEPVASGQRR